MNNKTNPCEKCGKRFKLLTDKNLCAYCDYPNWRSKYFIVPTK